MNVPQCVLNKLSTPIKPKRGWSDDHNLPYKLALASQEIYVWKCKDFWQLNWSNCFTNLPRLNYTLEEAKEIIVIKAIEFYKKRMQELTEWEQSQYLGA